MKKITYSLLLLFICTSIMAQTNTFPTSGNVGIGTTSPSDKLHVLGDVRITTGNYLKFGQLYSKIFENSSDHLVLQGHNGLRFQSYNGTEQVLYDDLYTRYGKVGIGTTSPNDLLHVSKSGANTRLRVGNNSAYDQLLYFNGAADWSMGMDNSNSNAFTIASTSSLDNSHRFTILSNGNTGIGTTAPASTLHVSSTTSNAAKIRLGRANNLPDDFLEISTVGGGGRFTQTGGSMDFYTSASTSTSNNFAMRIAGDGNVGIGTISPNERLSVSGQNVSFLSNTAYNIMQFGRNTSEKLQFQVEDNNVYMDYFQDSDNNGGHIFHIRNRAEGSSTDNDIRFSTSGEQRLAIKDNGNIGIGTTTPNEKLSVLGQDVSFFSGSLHNLIRMGRGTNENMSFRIEDYHAYLDYNQDDDGNADHILYIRNLAQGNSSNNDIRFATGGNTHVILKASGNLGLGTSNPGEKLEVNGNALIDGELYSKKVKVSANPGNWPDYVFASSYELRALSELENFIKTNHHLPEVPSATAIEKEGLDLGNMDATLLQKVEELTLYLIDINKKQEQLIKEVENLKKENEALKKKVKEQ